MGVTKRKKENSFQSGLIKELKDIFEGCVILKNDPNYIQGFPDLSLFYKDKWAILECKRGEHDEHQPNQDRYVEKLNKMGFSTFIYPENKSEVIEKLKRYFEK